MIIPAFSDSVTRRQHAAWNALVRRCRRLDDCGTGEGWVFHGTDHLASTHILHGAFQGLSGPRDRPWVHWGSAEMAAGWAESRAVPDSPPVLLAARTADVLASGTPYADCFAMEEGCNFRGDPFPGRAAAYGDASVLTGWRKSYLAVGAFLVEGGTRVAGLRRVGVSALPFHPMAARMRAHRQAGASPYVRRAHPADASAPIVTEASDGLFPNSWRDRTAWIAEMRPDIRREGGSAAGPGGPSP